MTDEQRAIVMSSLPRNAVVHINAVAGSGKTSTLRAWALARPACRILYIVFNKEAQESAATSMPPNVKARTFHSLALEVVNALFRARSLPPAAPSGFHKAPDFERAARTDASPEIAAFIGRQGVPRWLSELFGAYLRSTDLALTQEIVDKLVDESQHLPRGVSSVLPLAKRAAMHALSAAWRATLRGTLPVTFDATIKIMLINSPTVSANYDAVFIDEAQDFGRQYLAITLKWRETLPLIFVGDPNQKIYSWMGTANVFEEVEPTHRFELTQSFRFANAVAEFAQLITRKRIEGVSKGATRLEVVPSTDGTIPVALVFGHPTVVYIHRINVGLLLHAADIARKRNRVRICILGRGRQLLNDVTALLDMKQNESWKFEMRCREAAASGEDAQRRMLEWIEDSPEEVRAVVALLSDCIVNKNQEADVVLGTVHATKGQEYDCVVLSDDLLPRSTREYKLMQMKRAARGGQPPSDDEDEGDGGGGGGGGGSLYGRAMAARAGSNAALQKELPASDDETTDSEETETNRGLVSRHPKIERSEPWRLVYVASTRAKRLLVCSKKLHRAVRKRGRATWTGGAKEEEDGAGSKRKR